MELNYTKHARVRSQQRGIPPMMVDLLQRFGAEQPAGCGAKKVFFDKAAKRRVRVFAGSMSSVLEQHFDVYAILADNETVITAAHRMERIRR